MEFWSRLATLQKHCKTELQLWVCCVGSCRVWKHATLHGHYSAAHCALLITHQLIQYVVLSTKKLANTKIFLYSDQDIDKSKISAIFILLASLGQILNLWVPAGQRGPETSRSFCKEGHKEWKVVVIEKMCCAPVWMRRVDSWQLRCSGRP